MIAILGLTRVVVVHASVYDDNRRLLHGLEVLGGLARGVAVLIGTETQQELKAFDAQGVCGVRLNNISNVNLSPEAVTDAAIKIARRIANLGWHLQVYLKDDDLGSVLNHLADIPVPVVIDHFGCLTPEQPEQAGLLDLLTDQLAEGRCWIKLSASYRLGGNGAEAARQLTHRFIAANPERLVWGSDWPHTPAKRDPKFAKQEQPFREINTKNLLTGFLEVVPDQTLQHRILVDNPAKLYDFD